MTTHRVAASLLVVACAASAFAQTEWTLDPQSPVLEPAPPGSWDWGFRLIEAVVEVDGVYHMFYRGQPDPEEVWTGTYSIGHATSPDGISWAMDPANPVLTPGSDTDWDHGSMRGAAVIHDGDRFRMWYASVTSADSGYEQWHGVGHATSTDGSTWSKSPENPIIGLCSGGPSPIPQTVLFDGERFFMWYFSSSPSYECEHPASSEDGMSWGGFLYRRPDRLQPDGLSVVDDGTNYYMMKWTWGWWPFIWGAASPIGSGRWSNFVDYPLISGAASPAMLVDGDTIVMWYSSYDGIHRATSTCCDTIYTWFVLAAASGPGASGSFYRTEVEINNASDAPAEYRFAWFPRDRDNTEWIRSGLFQVQPDKSVRYSDVLADVFGLGPGNFGALAVEATAEDVLVAARILSSDGQNAGAYGQDVPVIRVDEFYRFYSSYFPGQRILFGTENADERFNITCFQGRDLELSAPVELDLVGSDGTLLGTEFLLPQPWGSHQLNRIFADHRPVEGYVQVRHRDSTYCFGSRIDNRTNDPTTILPR